MSEIVSFHSLFKLGSYLSLSQDISAPIYPFSLSCVLLDILLES
jgi:hypothetical protein